MNRQLLISFTALSTLVASGLVTRPAHAQQQQLQAGEVPGFAERL